MQSLTPSTGTVLQMAWPLTLKAMMLHGIIVIDAYLVSGLGEQALAAMGLAASLGGVLLGVLFAFSSATQIRLAQAFGSGRPVALKTGFYAGIIINLVMASIGLVLVLIFGDRIITAFAHTPDIATQAQAYLHVFLLVVLIEAVGQCLGSFFNGCGNTKTPFYSYLIALPVNVTVSVVLIHGLYGLPELGVVGAAVGTVVAAVTRTIFMGVHFYNDTCGYRDVAGWLHATLFISLKRHLKFAAPIAGTFVSMTLATNVCALIYAKMNINAFAAMTLIAPWVQVAGTFGIAWAQATGITVAQLLAKDTPGDALDEFLSRAWRMAFVAAGVVSVTYLILCLASGRLYADLQDETRAALFSFLPVLLLLPFPKGSNAICGQSLRAGGDTLYVMHIFIVGSWLCKVPLTVLFVVYLELPVFWVFSLFLAEELVKFPLFHLRFYSGKWKLGGKDDE
ncbi:MULTISPECIES: MATE family efflux transporter [Rhodobacterales]|uniref:MATE family efflux transporter n=1 Tax=Rhodobacterales TaxID=204455 RepID=UPI0015EFF0C9|nr:MULTISPECIES: MATE family efflux transporter [Rhodobacterales]MDO6591195.1 MATE family efflux transporter [Yoonia sp. 1_MG-2023]